MALKLDILANTRQFVGEMKKAGASTDDVSDALDDMSREGKQAGDRLERSFKDIAKESERTGRKVGNDMDDGFKKAGKGAQDFKQESASTARESAASFDGSAESIADSFQEVAANAFAGFGPAGAVAGIAVAAGIGTAITALQNAHAATEELKLGIKDMYLEAAEDGRVFLSEAQVQAEATRLLFEDGTRLREESKKLGVDVITLARAYAGNQEDANVAIESGNALLDERQQKAQENLETLGAAPQKVDLEAESIRQVIGLLEQQGKWHVENQASAQQVADMKKRHAEAERADVKKTQDLLHSLMAPTLKPTLDTSALDAQIRRYRPPKVFIPGRIVGNDGKQLVG